MFCDIVVYQFSSIVGSLCEIFAYNLGSLCSFEVGSKMSRVWFLSVSLTVFSVLKVSGIDSETTFDPNGYVLYCPCMGKLKLLQKTSLNLSLNFSFQQTTVTLSHTVVMAELPRFLFFRNNFNLLSLF